MNVDLKYFYLLMQPKPQHIILKSDLAINLTEKRNVDLSLS